MTANANDATLLDDFWYVVARSSDLGAAPLARKINGRPLVVFRDQRGAAHVLDAICPHRGANLADGRVVDGTITCPYHGWRFDGTGRCTRIPANHDPARVPPAYTTDSYPVREQQGLIWTTIGKPTTAPSSFPALEDRTSSVFCYEVSAKLPFDWWVENALDFAHLPFVHPRTIGDDGSKVDELTIERRDDQLGFIARGKSKQPHSILDRLLKLELRVDVTLEMPGNAVFDVDLGKGRRQVIIALATPEDANTTRTWNFSVRNFLRVPFGNMVGMWFMRRVVDEDVEMGERSLAPISIDRDGMLSSRADALSLEYLRLLRVWRSRAVASRSTG